MQTQLPAYVPVLILGAVAIGFAVFTIVLSHLLGRPRPNPQKNSIYECGMPAVGNARER
jgi:NADH-quinone oxidoreductase subunit A